MLTGMVFVVQSVGWDAVESRIKPCDLAVTLTKAIIVGYLGLYSICWIFCFLRFLFSIKGHSADLLLLLQAYNR
jgi:hypothetical protein